MIINFTAAAIRNAKTNHLSLTSPVVPHMQMYKSCLNLLRQHVSWDF